MVGLLLVGTAFSQPITGVWRGKITKGTGLRQSSQTVELKFIKQGDSLVGTAYYYGIGRNFVRYSIKGYFDPAYNTVHWQDYQLIDSRPKRTENGKKYKESLKGEADFSCPDGRTMRLDGTAELPEEPAMTVELKKMEKTFFPDEWDWVIDGYFSGMAQREIIDSVWMIASEGTPSSNPTAGATAGDIAVIPAKPKEGAVLNAQPPAQKKEQTKPSTTVITNPEKSTSPATSVVSNPAPTTKPPVQKEELVENPFYTGGGSGTAAEKTTTPAATLEKKDSMPAINPKPASAATAKLPPAKDSVAVPKPTVPVFVNTTPKQDSLPPAAKQAPPVATTKPPAPKPAQPRDITEEMAKRNREAYAKQTTTETKLATSVTPQVSVKDTVQQAPPLVINKTPEKEPPVVKTITAPVMGTAFATRKKIVQTTIPAMGDSIELRFYDNAEVDGDSISLFLNGIALFQHVRLDVRPYIFKISVTDLPAESELTMVAENLGAIPPNTAYMEAYVNGQRYTARLESTEVTSGVIRLVRKE